MTDVTTAADRLSAAVYAAKARGVSISSIAASSKTDRAHLKRMMKGEVGIGREKALALAPVLSVPISWLLGEVGVSVPPALSPPAHPPAIARQIDAFLKLPDQVRAAVLFMGTAAARQLKGRPLFRYLDGTEQGTSTATGTPRKQTARAKAKRTSKGN